jgi:hypothetical protein
MILFYSEFCQHCTVLLETIKRHDKNNMIKLVSIDLLRSLQKPIDPKIHSVPALMLTTTKEYMFGKNVFDYLLLPNRGVLFSTQMSRDNKPTKDTSDPNMPVIPSKPDVVGEPMAFSLGAISAEQFSSIDDDENALLNDKNYNWDVISDSAVSIASTVNESPRIDTLEISKPKEGSTKAGLPSMEEIMKQRASDIL